MSSSASGNRVPSDAGDADLAAALAGWEIAGARLDALAGGAANEHWRVESAAGVRVLRRYHPRRDLESLPYEHRLLRFLKDRDWPVAAPIATAVGETVVQTERALWALFPFMRGEPPPSAELWLQRKGSVLALLHADLAEWEATGQRPGFGRVSDLDRAVAPEGFRSFEELLASYADEDPERAAVLAETRQRNAADLDARGYAAQPDGAVYYECFGANVLFVDDTVTALLDFDMAHEDARVADVARSLVVDCGSDGAKVRAWLAGYSAHAAPRLSAEEAELIPPLMVASELWNTVVPLAMSARQRSEALLRSAHTSIDHRLPLFEAVQPVLGRAAKAAAS
ncbi:MAG: phosphotransferase [Chloroflexi bacterium]|nr:phosphotransferase [Chloroflexota bacterium]